MILRPLLLDVDGTLSNSLKEVTPRTQAAVVAYQAAGGIVSLATGRCILECQAKMFSFFSPDQLHILCTGAQLARGTGEILWEANLESAVVQVICERVLTDPEAWFNFQQADKYITSPNKLEYKSSQGFDVAEFSPSRSWQTPRLSVGNLNAETILWLQGMTDISMKEMVSSRGEQYFDITLLGHNKATGAQRWCDVMNVDVQDCIAVGDGGNDREILQAVGHGVAMGNASDSIKSIANEVIGYCDEDGLAIFIEGLLQA